MALHRSEHQSLMLKHEKVYENTEVRVNQQTFCEINPKLDVQTRPLKTYGLLFIVVVSVLLAPPGLSAKPKLDKFGKCVIPSKCTTNSIDATCAKLYCKALAAKCDGEYSSGECHDIKELHDKGNCSLARSGCGDTLPKILLQQELPAAPQAPQEIYPGSMEGSPKTRPKLPAREERTSGPVAARRFTA